MLIDRVYMPAEIAVNSSVEKIQTSTVLLKKNTSQQFTINSGSSFAPGFLLGALVCTSLCTGDLPGGGHGIERGSLFPRLGESGVSVIADTGWGSSAIGGEGAPMWLLWKVIWGFGRPVSLRKASVWETGLG